MYLQIKTISLEYKNGSSEQLEYSYRWNSAREFRDEATSNSKILERTITELETSEEHLQWWWENAKKYKAYPRIEVSGLLEEVEVPSINEFKRLLKVKIMQHELNKIRTKNGIEDLYYDNITKEVEMALNNYERITKKSFLKNGLKLYIHPSSINTEVALSENLCISTYYNNGNRFKMARLSSVEDLQQDIKVFSNYEKLYYLMKEELPTVIKDLLDWEKQYEEKSIAYLNSLDFHLER